MSRLVLVRHGRSAHVHPGSIDAAGFRAWRAAYEAASIRDDERAPPLVEHWARAADLVVASSAVRASASATVAAPGRDVVISPLLRELELEGPSLWGLRLPLPFWAIAVGGRNLAQRARGQYPPASDRERLRAAADWLDELSTQHRTIVAFTHGWFRRHLTAELARVGWRAGRDRSLSHWSAWFLERTPSMTWPP